mmetsp:Transcript_15952/g.48044  ORF Transcript_15952/g.48044 Transcript_15952/m.48044 type:complete len:200 (-) Transcript_15952:2-601(-)
MCSASTQSAVGPHPEHAAIARRSCTTLPSGSGRRPGLCAWPTACHRSQSFCNASPGVWPSGRRATTSLKPGMVPLLASLLAMGVAKARILSMRSCNTAPSASTRATASFSETSLTAPFSSFAANSERMSASRNRPEQTAGSASFSAEASLAGGLGTAPARTCEVVLRRSCAAGETHNSELNISATFRGLAATSCLRACT